MPAVPERGARLTPDEDVARHLHGVVRLRPGEALRIYDPTGREADAVVDHVDGRVVWLQVTGEPVLRAPRPALWLVIGTPKGPAMDLAVRMGTELGITHLVPAITRRSVARPDRADRFVRIAEAAAQQCGRTDVVTVLEPLPWDQALAAVPPDLDRRVAVPGAPLGARATGPAAVAVGPEGGLDDHEVARALAAGWVATGLGPWVMRADTAAVAALAQIAPA